MQGRFCYFCIRHFLPVFDAAIFNDFFSIDNEMFLSLLRAFVAFL